LPSVPNAGKNFGTYAALAHANPAAFFIPQFQEIYGFEIDCRQGRTEISK